jgi:hypothetical protein
MQTGLYLFECGTPTAIIENKLTHNLFPNPTQHQFTIMSSEATSFELFNTMGKKVNSKKISSNQTIIKRNGLADGLYFYMLKNKNKKVGSGKVIFE